MRQRDYKDRTTVSLSIERDVKKEIEQIAGSESFSSFVNRLLEQEIERRKKKQQQQLPSKKVNGLDAIGVALALNGLGLGQSNSNQRLVNILRDFATTKHVYNKCKEDNITLDEWTECSRYVNVIEVGLNNFRPNIGRELKA